jgi:hypothetical protein
VHVAIRWRNLKERYNLEDLGADGGYYNRSYINRMGLRAFY